MGRCRCVGSFHVGHDHMALIMNQFKFGSAHNVLLQTINFIILVIAIWIAIEGLVKFFSPTHPVEDPAPVGT